MELIEPTRGTEAGELQEADGGTWLRLSVEMGRIPLLVVWLARLRVRENLRALAGYCESGVLVPQRPPIRWTRWEAPLTFGWLILAAIGVPMTIWVPLMVFAFLVAAWRGWQLARRFRLI
jgi:hypothetical protein